MHKLQMTGAVPDAASLQLTGESEARRRIAQMLCISAKTVDRHRDNLIEKLKIKQEDELLEYAKSFGLTGIW